MTTSHVKKLNELVNSFLSEHVQDSKTLRETWNSDSMQTPLRKVLGAQSSKPVKDANAPKKAQSGYLFFCEENRARISRENPNMSATEITTELGKQWTELKENKSRQSEFERFQQAALRDKERYQQEMSSYVPPVATRQRGKKRAEPAVKRAKTAYLFFCQAKRPDLMASNPSMTAPEVTTELGRLWTLLKNDTSAASQQERKRYEDMAEQDKSRFQSESAGNTPAPVTVPVPVQTPVATPSGRGKRSQVACTGDVCSVVAPPQPVETQTPARKPRRAAESAPVQAAPVVQAPPPVQAKVGRAKRQ